MIKASHEIRRKPHVPPKTRFPPMLPVTVDRGSSYMFMIRRFSVLCKLNNIKISDRKWFEDAANAPLDPDQPCPHCSARGCLRLFGHYSRYLVEWDGKTQKNSTVIVPRYICDSCGHTHALLPSCLIPYKSYSLRFLLSVLRAYFIRSCPVEQICARYGITIAMLYRWLHLFQRHKELWLGVLENMSARPVHFIDRMEGILLEKFFQAFRFSYLEGTRSLDLEMLSQKSCHLKGVT